MNKIFLGEKELSSEELAKWSNDLHEQQIGKRINPFSASDYEGEKSRITGSHCYCAGNGEFELMPLNHEDVTEGGKAYMSCRICGGFSHL